MPSGDKKELQAEIASLRAEIRRLRKSLSELTPPLSALLRRRGFRIYKKEPADDLLLPARRHLDDYYHMLTRYSFRLFLRDVIQHQSSFTVKDVTRYATQGVTEGYVRFLLEIGLLKEIRPNTGEPGRRFRLRKTVIKSFGPTLEWFLAEIFKREFSVEAIWGIKFKRPVVGGDYDLIAKVDGAILLMEIKSSPPKQIYAKEISALFSRVLDLRPGIAVFFMDTELRMKDKIVPMFEEELTRRAPFEVPGFWEVSSPPAVERIEKELFHIGNKIFIINAKDSIVNNIERVLRWYFRRS